MKKRCFSLKKRINEKLDSGKMMKLGMISALILVILANVAWAATGDVLRQLNPTPSITPSPTSGPTPGPTPFPTSGGEGRGMAFDGKNLYYTLLNDGNIHKVDTNGNFVGNIPIPLQGGKGGPLAWDGTNLWTIDYGTGGDLVQLSPSGTKVSTCNIFAANPGNPALTPSSKIDFADGLDWTGIPGSELVLSGEGERSGGGNSVIFMNTSCKIQSSFTPATVNNLGTSGVAFDGKNLWHAHPSFYLLFDQTNLAGTNTGNEFSYSNITIYNLNLASFEDLAYDDVTFAPKCALWANDIGIRSGSPSLSARTNNLTAIEIPCGPKGSISGMKFNDTNFNTLNDGEPGLNGWTITLSNNGTVVTQLTSGNGNYNFTGLSPGTYTVAETIQPGWLQVWPQCGPGPSYTGSCTYTINLNGENVVGEDFGNFKLGIISGTKFNDINGNGIKDPGEPGLPNWTINYRLGNVTDSTITDNNGNYNFSGLLTGTYIISEDIQTGWIQTSPAVSLTGSETRTVNISTSGVNKTGQDFGNFKLGKISGTKFEDLNANGIKDVNESGLAGWIITIKGIDTITNTSVNLSTTSDINGDYNFSGLTAGTYTVSEILQNGWIQATPANGSYAITITSGAVIAGQNFGNFHKGKITGGGGIPPKATFGLTGQYPDNKNVAQGNVEYQDKVANLNIKSIQINTVATSVDNKKGVITGLAQVNGTGSYPFEVYVEDNGEPGKDIDVFKISLPTYSYSNGAILNSGNIQIHN